MEMVDLSATIIAKSDQLNADDLIGSNLTITITDVRAVAREQPIAISYQGDNGKPWYPCKTMRRVLMHVWGRDGKSYIGKKVTLYRDPTVTFGGLAVGGIRISHMSGITERQQMVLTATRKSKKPYVVEPLIENTPKPQPEPNGEKAEAAKNDILAGIEDSENMEALKEFLDKNNSKLNRLYTAYQDKYKEVADAIATKEQSFTTETEDF